MPDNFLGKTSENSLTTATTGPGIQLTQIHTVGSSFRSDYMLYDILQFIPIQGGKLVRLLGTVYGYLVLA
jgi:hypothetical protein